MLRRLFLLILAGTFIGLGQEKTASMLHFEARKRVETPKGTGNFKAEFETVRWDPKKTAIIICDMWDAHWCKGASERVAEIAPRMNEVVQTARKRGVTIIHAPSETMEFYKDTPQRKRAQSAPAANPGEKIDRWKRIDTSKEPPLPIDDSDGGCDDIPRCKGGPPYPWKRQIATIEIAPQDVITDNGQEVYNFLQQQGIDNLLVMGVHANMCVLGRSFAIRQMVSHGKNVLLMRDMTDTMYCSRMKPYTNHFRGTDLVVEHIEKYWCPSITSTAFTGKPAFHFKADVESGSQTSAELRRKSADDIAGNEAVRQHIEQFKGRGQTVEAGAGAKPLSPKESLAHFRIPDDLEITLAAAEPDVRQPVCLNFDDRGRMWVVQYLQYPFPAGLKVLKYDEHLRAVFDKVPEPPPNGVPGADKVTIFEDKDGDGYFESHHDFVTGLNIATSALPGKDGVWVMNPPYLLFYPDKNHDDVPDGPPEVHLAGFGLEDTHAVANSLTWGPDGWIYGAQGSTCTATVKGIHFLGQAIWRYHPETHDFELFAEGGGNTFAVEFDRKGRLFSGTNWGNQRGLYYVQGGYYVKAWGKHGPLTNPHAYGFFPHMTHKGDEARFSHSFIIYEGDSLPERYFGKLIAIVPLQNRIQVSDLPRDGSTFKTIDVERAVETDDKWFRPVDIKSGPDGAVYFADWYDIRLTHVDPRDNWDRSNGRIYRLSAKGNKSKPVDLTRASTDELIGLLSSSNKWMRQHAVRQLAERTGPVTQELRNLLDNPDGQLALAALWALYTRADASESTARKCMSHKDPAVRMWAVRLSGERHTKLSDSTRERLLELARYETDSQVRSQLASTVRRLPDADAPLGILAELLHHQEDTSDPHIPLLLWWALESKAISNRAEVSAMFATGSAWDNPLVAQHILPRLVQRYAAEATEADLQLVARFMKVAAAQAQRETLLKAIAEGLNGTGVTKLPDSLRGEIARTGDKNDINTLVLKLRLAATTEADREVITAILRNDQETVKADRTKLIEACGSAGDESLIAPLLEIAKTSRWHSVRRAALQALQQFNTPEIGREILQVYAHLPKEEGVRAKAIDVLSKRPEWSHQLLVAISEKEISAADVPFEVQERIRLHNDPAVHNLAQKVWGATRQTSDEKRKRMDEIAKVLQNAKGNAIHGKQLFGATCATCHKLHGEGNSIGPDLTGYERDNLDFWLLAIIDPSAGIREEYTNFELQTADGLLLTGFVLERAAQTVTIQDGEQGRVTVPKSKIKSLRASPVSRMPEGLLDSLSSEDIRDVFAYLRSPGPIATAP